jgi:hypothetical protein
VNLTELFEPRWVVLAASMLLPIGLAVATLWIQWHNRRTRQWSETTGRIESARVRAGEVTSKRFRTSGTARNTEFMTDEDTRTRNFARVTYSFAVGGTTYRANRICLMGEPDGSIAAVLRRYPQGRIVSVYYDPDDPNQCILERENPAKIREAWLGVAALAGLILAGFAVVDWGVDWLRTIIARPDRAPAMTLLAAISLIVLMISRAITKQARAMKKWPTTVGRIVRSEIITSVQHHSRPNSARPSYDVTMYRPRIVYTYEVGGDSFEGDDVGWSTSANTRGPAEKQVKRYPLQSQVSVFYNPDDPAEATLSPSMGLLPPILWAIASAIAFAAAALGWLIP